MSFFSPVKTEKKEPEPAPEIAEIADKVPEIAEKLEEEQPGFFADESALLPSEPNPTSGDGLEDKNHPEEGRKFFARYVAGISIQHTTANNDTGNAKYVFCNKSWIEIHPDDYQYYDSADGFETKVE